MIYINLTVTTNQRCTKDTQRIKRTELKQKTKENQQIIREKNKRRKGKNRTIEITKNNLQNGSKHTVIIIILNEKCSKCSNKKKSGAVAGVA